MTFNVVLDRSYSSSKVYLFFVTMVVLAVAHFPQKVPNSEFNQSQRYQKYI